jgi:hypothetical protein
MKFQPDSRIAPGSPIEVSYGPNHRRTEMCTFVGYVGEPSQTPTITVRNSKGKEWNIQVKCVFDFGIDPDDDAVMYVYT